MKLTLKQFKWSRISLSNVYVISLVSTMIILLMRKKEVLIQTSLFREDSLKNIQEQLAVNSPLFVFVLKERLKVVIALFLMATTSIGTFFVHINVLWYGICSGLFLTIVLMRYGVKGILLLAAGVFPHYLIYVPALILTLQLSKEKRVVNSKYCGQLLVISIVVIIGCILECYVNPKVVANMLKIF